LKFFFLVHMAGRKPLPVAVKKIKGTLQKCRTNPNEPRPMGKLGDPPEYMSDIAKEAWTYAVENAPPGLLSSLDAAVLERWANCAGLFWGGGDDHQDPQRHLAPLPPDGRHPGSGPGDEGL
jgi:hypothetical protein